MPRKTNRTLINVFDKDIVAEEQYYLGDRGLPTSESKYEYTPEMIDALERCQDDIIYFSENYFTIIDKGVRKHIPLRPYQKKFLESMKNENRLLLLTGRQSGNCVCYDTNVKVRFTPLGISFNIKIGKFFKLIKFFQKMKNIFKKK